MYPSDEMRVLQRSALALCVLCSVGPAVASEACDPCGASATYSEALWQRGDGKWRRTITTTGCPNHYSYCTGKGSDDDCGYVGEEGVATQATDQDKSYIIPGTPVMRIDGTQTKCTRLKSAKATSFGPAGGLERCT